MYVIFLEYHDVGVLDLVCLFALFVLSLFRFRFFLPCSFIIIFVIAFDEGERFLISWVSCER